MARLRAFARRLAALPYRARAALAAAVVLAIVAVLLLVVPGGGDGADSGDRGGDDTAVEGGTDALLPSTTLRTGGIEVDAPEGWQAIPLPALGFGIAVPPDWETVVLSPEALAALSNASPEVPDFAENAHAAAGEGGLVYGAGEDEGGGISDVMVRAAPESGVTDTAGLEAYAGELAAHAGRSNPQIDVVEDAALPSVRLRFRVGADGEVAEGTETLVLGPEGIVWSIIVTSDDAANHDDLATAITDTLTLAES